MTEANWFARLFRKPRPASHRRRRWGRDRLIAGTAAAFVTVAILAIFVDAASITAARQLPEGVIHFFQVITSFGKSGWVLWPLAALLFLSLLVSWISTRAVNLLLGAIAVRMTFFFAAIAIPGLFTNLVKGLVGRARPFVGGSADPYLFEPFNWHSKYASFPSGHGTTAFSVAVAVGALWPRARWLAWAYAGAIVISRVVLTAHHPSDVLAGALIGGLGALIVRDYFASRSLGFYVGRDGRVRVMPGPSLARIKGIWPRIKRVAETAGGS